MTTFGDVGVPLPIVDDEAPEEADDEVHEVDADAVAQPRLRQVRQPAPPVARHDHAEEHLVVPARLLPEQPPVLAALVLRCRHCRQRTGAERRQSRCCSCGISAEEAMDTCTEVVLVD